MKYYFLPCILFFAYHVQAQKGTLLIHVQPHDAVIKINDQLFLSKGNPVEWDAGNYVLKMQSPRTELVTDSFNIKSGQLTMIRKRLPYSQHYQGIP